MSRSLLALTLMLFLPLAAAQLHPGPATPPPPPSELDLELAKVSDVDALREQVAGYHLAGDHAAVASVWARLAQLRPHVGQIKIELAAAQARLGKRSEAYTALLALQTQGYGLEIEDDPRFEPVADTNAWKYIVQSLQTNLSPFGEGEVAFRLPRQDLLIESLAWDASAGQLLVGGIREGTVYRLGKNAELLPFIKADAENGMWAVMDIEVDASRNVLWVASTAVPHYKRYQPEKDLGRAGVFKFDLKTGAFLKSYLSPVLPGSAFFMSTLALAPDGTVYAADGVNNAVYMVRDDQLRRVFHATTLTSIRGMTVSGNGRTLYFSDAELGIFGYDLSSSRPFDVGVPKTLALAGIDGLVWWQDSLLAVQNGMQPARVMRLLLAPDGQTFSGAKPLAAAMPEFGMPTQATLDGKRLLFIANSQKHQYDRFGLPRNSDALEGTRIYAVEADYASDLAGSLPTGRPGADTSAASPQAPAAEKSDPPSE